MVCKSIYAKLLFFSFRAKEIGDKIFGDCKKSYYKFPIIAGISDESNISNAKHFLPKSLSDAPIW